MSATSHFQDEPIVVSSYAVHLGVDFRGVLETVGKVGQRLHELSPDLENGIRLMMFLQCSNSGAT